MKKKIFLGIFSLVTIFLVAIVSIATTFGVWDGALPSAYFKINIIDNQRTPIEGAHLTIFKKHGFWGLKKSISYNLPIQEFSKESQPISNNQGIIKISHITDGLEIGGGAFALFWVIPVSFGDSKFIVRVTAPDGKEASFDYSDLYGNCNVKPTILNRKDNPVTCGYNLVLK